MATVYLCAVILHGSINFCGEYASQAVCNREARAAASRLVARGFPTARPRCSPRRTYRPAR